MNGRSVEWARVRNKQEPAGHVLQRAAINPSPLHEVPPVVHEVLRRPGQPVDAATRAFMEARFGHDFSGVRVHADGKAAESARAVDALAYTVGRDVVFAMGKYAPSTSMGQSLLAHELAHVVQQGGASSSRPLPGRLAMDPPAGAREREASAAVRCIAVGAQAGPLAAPHKLALQRQTPDGETEEVPPEKKEPGEVIAEGMKTVAEQATDNNPKVKSVIIDPMKDRLKRVWGRLGTGEKAATIGFGAGTLGLAGGTLLSDPGGRKVLEGVNLAAPFTLIPYMPLSGFKYTLPKGEGPDERLFKFETDFKADELINLRTKSRGLPEMSLSVSMQWGFDPSTDRLSVLGGSATLGLVPGLSISGGAYKDILRPFPTFAGPGGGLIESRKSIPELGAPKQRRDVRVMVTVDLLKFRPNDLVRQVGSIFGAK